MGQAYTPGLKVSTREVLLKERILPLKGEIKVKKGDLVGSEDVVAATNLPGKVELVNVVNKLSIAPDEVEECLKVKPGDSIKKGQLLAESKGIFGFFKSALNSPIDGVIESVSNITGQMVLRHPPIPIEVKAYVRGIIDEIIPNEGVIIKLNAAFIQGIFGIGGETVGELAIVSKDISDELTAENITEEHKGKIIVGGSYINSDALKKAIKVGAKGIIVGGIDAKDLKEFLGYDIGVAITGSEDVGITLVTTEGFGKINMAQKTFDLLSSYAGKKTSINGATQIRAGVIRPEIIIPLDDKDMAKSKQEDSGNKVSGLVEGRLIRIIREPDFGQVVKIKSLPVELHTVESETKVRVVEVEYPDGKTRIVPRANIEIIEL
jgi:hypothetical protein